MIAMSVDTFVRGTREYLAHVLSGVCQEPSQIQLAVQVTSGGVFLRARVAPADFAAIKFSGTYPALKELIRRVAAIRINDATSMPFEAHFQLYDPSFEVQFASHGTTDFWKLHS